MKFLVTAGPTREHLDPVRFLSNRSTGRMGFAVAAAAAAAGHECLLVAGPVSLPTPEGVERVDVVSALEMLDAVRDGLADADALVMCAAVADWRPKTFAPTKLKKLGMAPVIELEPNPDILKEIAPMKAGRVFVGFAAETGDPCEEAARKLAAKGLDMIVANDVSRPDSGFAVDTNRVTFIFPSGRRTFLPLLKKAEVGARIVAAIESMAGNGGLTRRGGF